MSPIVSVVEQAMLSFCYEIWYNNIKCNIDESRVSVVVARRTCSLTYVRSFDMRRSLVQPGADILTHSRSKAASKSYFKSWYFKGYHSHETSLSTSSFYSPQDLASLSHIHIFFYSVSAKYSPPDNQLTSRHLVPDDGDFGDRNRSRSALAFISMLPTELLAQIFSEYVSQFHPEDYVYYPGGFRLEPTLQGPGYYAWIVIMHVCSQWRTVAIEEPTLWGRIRNGSKPRRNASERCSNDQNGQCSIDMCFEQLHITSVLAELRRIKRLRIHGDAGHLMNVVCAASSQLILREAPNLRTLQIDSPFRERHIERSNLLRDPLHLAGEWVRNLQSIEVSSAESFPWGLPVPFSGLRHLKLGPDAWCQSTREDVLRALEQFPLLETLSLRLVHGRWDEMSSTVSASQQSPNVPLRKLRSILLIGTDECCIDILDHLLIPPPGHHLSQVLQQSRNNLRPLDKEYLYEARRHHATDIDGRFWRNTEVSSHLSPDKVHYNLDMTSKGFNMHMWKTFWSSPLVLQVKILDLSNLHRSLFYFGSFHYMGDVETLRLHCFDNKLVQALLGQTEGTTPEGFIFPRLRILMMDRVRFGDQTVYESQTSSEALRAVADCLIQRHQNNIAITHLILTNCVNLDEHAVAIFRELVPRVSWDGNVNLDDEEFDELPRTPSDRRNRRSHGNDHDEIRVWGIRVLV
ncbi:uncharacterized protein LAESUDRAFT_751857 [Laetiporus sulphureus 93-53]|uniref:Uncharacterized protein n=1 Tax=Laetiporus sulphureus 93-53 TaxID=1314785 RepID=A0A165CMU1_9APHY|nr:uncharacterized protein LAESUDRAFT_751857 [Laetiporus sulphureus 93-53]KZT03098.1 hypothetical protein LAESUDRAFT_751857 [Laetiporus sulphureus 93-53]